MATYCLRPGNSTVKIEVVVITYIAASPTFYLTLRMFHFLGLALGDSKDAGPSP